MNLSWLKYALAITLSILLAAGCSSSNDNTTTESPLDGSGSPSGNVGDGSSNEVPIGFPTNDSHTDLSKTEFSKQLYMMKDLCSANNKKAMFGLKNAHVFKESEVDENGYKDGLIVSLLLFEDFTYRLMVWDSKIEILGFFSYRAITEENTRADIKGNWVAHGNIDMSLDINVKSQIFNFSENGGESKPVVDIRFGESLPEEIKELEGENLWAIHRIVKPIKNEDLSCEEN